MPYFLNHHPLAVQQAAQQHQLHHAEQEAGRHHHRTRTNLKLKVKLRKI